MLAKFEKVLVLDSKFEQFDGRNGEKVTFGKVVVACTNERGYQETLRLTCGQGVILPERGHEIDALVDVSFYAGKSRFRLRSFVEA